MRLVKVEPGGKPQIINADETPECWETIEGNGWSACVQDGDDEFNFVATELAEYLGWYEDLTILTGTVIFMGEHGGTAPDYVVRAALRWTGVTG